MLSQYFFIKENIKKYQLEGNKNKLKVWEKKLIVWLNYYNKRGVE